MSHPDDLMTSQGVTVPGAIAAAARTRTLAAFDDPAQPVTERITAFYSTLPTSKYAGSMFTRLLTDSYQIEAGDLWATSLLSVPVPAQYGEKLLLDPQTRARTAELLVAIDPALQLAELTDEEAEVEIARALEFYRHLRDQRRPGSSAWVMPAKLAARKRPHLLPVRDNLVFLYLEGNPKPHTKTILRQAVADIWLMRFLLRDPEVSERLTQVIASVSSNPNVLLDTSRLRILDTVLWTYAMTDSAIEPPPVLEPA